MRNGATTPKEIVAQVYTDVSPKAHSMAERAVLAHLEKLRDEGEVVLEGEKISHAKAQRKTLESALRLCVFA